MIPCVHTLLPHKPGSSLGLWGKWYTYLAGLHWDHVSGGLRTLQTPYPHGLGSGHEWAPRRAGSRAGKKAGLSETSKEWGKPSSHSLNCHIHSSFYILRATLDDAEGEMDTTQLLTFHLFPSAWLSLSTWYIHKTHTHTHTHTETQRHTQTHTHRNTHRHTHTETQTHTQTNTETHTHTDTHTQTHTDTHTHRRTQTHTHRSTHTQRHTHTQTHTDTHTQRHTHTEVHTHTQLFRLLCIFKIILIILVDDHIHKKYKRQNEN